MILQKLIPHPPSHVAKFQLKGVTTITVTALLIPGPIHPPKEKYSLSGLVHPPKVKYSLKLQIPAHPRQVQKQTYVRSTAHPPRATVG